MPELILSYVTKFILKIVHDDKDTDNEFKMRMLEIILAVVLAVFQILKLIM